MNPAKTWLKIQLLWDIFDPLPLGRFRRLSRPVDGWLTRREERLLFCEARRVDCHQCIVELGSWFGRSAILLGGGSRMGGGARIFAIDLFEAAGCSKELFEERAGAEAKDFLNRFQENMEAAGVAEQITAIRSETAEAGKRWEGPPIGFLFLDADHSFEAVKGDWESWKGHVARGGRIAFHDYANPDYEVTRFVDGLIDRNEIRKIGRHDSILVAEVR